MKKNVFDKYKDNRIIRLVYVAFEKYIDTYHDTLRYGETIGVSSPFQLPEGVSFENACKIISALSEKVEKEENIPEASFKSVGRVTQILDKYGFTKLNAQDFNYEADNHHANGEYIPLVTAKRLGVPEVEGVVDLITVGANDDLFEKTKMNKRYFDWFVPGVKLDEILKDDSREL